MERRTRFLAFTTDTVALYSLGQSRGLQSDELSRGRMEPNNTCRSKAHSTPEAIGMFVAFFWSTASRCNPFDYA